MSFKGGLSKTMLNDTINLPLHIIKSCPRPILPRQRLTQLITSPKELMSIRRSLNYHYGTEQRPVVVTIHPSDAPPALPVIPDIGLSAIGVLSTMDLSPDDRYVTFTGIRRGDILHTDVEMSRVATRIKYDNDIVDIGGAIFRLNDLVNTLLRAVSDPIDRRRSRLHPYIEEVKMLNMCLLRRLPMGQRIINTGNTGNIIQQTKNTKNNSENTKNNSENTKNYFKNTKNYSKNSITTLDNTTTPSRLVEDASFLIASMSGEGSLTQANLLALLLSTDGIGRTEWLVKKALQKK